MKKILLFLMAAFLMLSMSVNAQNLVVNGDFETGTRAPWNSWNNAITNVADEVYQGTWAGRLKPWKGASFFQVISVVPGNTYDVSFTAKWAADPDWYEGIALEFISNDGAKTFLGASAKVNTTDWTTISDQITVPAGYAEVRVTLYKPSTPACFIDSVSVKDLGAIKPALTVTYDGEILEGAEDGEQITVSMLSDTYAATLTAANWTFSWLPEGVSVGSVTRVNDTAAIVTLSGNSTGDYDDDMKDIGVVITAAEFVTCNEDVQSGLGINFTAVQEPKPELSMTDDGEINEDFEDGEQITVSLVNYVFVDPLTPANWTIDKPEGVGIGSLTRVNDTAVVVTLAGNTTGDYDNNITDATITVAGEEFVNNAEGPASVSSGVTFIGNIEGGELVLWEENFDGYADGTNLLDTVGGLDYGFVWELMDSAMVYGGVADVHLTHAGGWSTDSVDHRIQHQEPVEIGKTYIFYGDSRTDDGKSTVMSVLVEGGQFMTENTGSTEWRTRSVVVEPSLPEHDTVGMGFYTWGWNVENSHIYIDNLKFVVLTEPKLSATDDGDITEGAEDGEVISVSLQNVKFAATLNAANWSISGLPEGVSIGSVTRVDDNNATITLSGNSTEDYDVDIAAVVSAIRDELDGSNKTLSSEAFVFTAIEEPPVLSMSDDGEIKEAAENLEVITVVLSGDTLVASLTPANWTLIGQPAGVSIGEVYRVDDFTVEITLSGDATEDYDVDITDATLTVTAAEFKEYDMELSVNTGVTFIATIEDAIADMEISGLNIYPNPVADRLFIKANTKISSLEVFNVLGSKILDMSDVDSYSFDLDASAWSTGLYHIKLIDVEDNTSVVNIIK